MKGKSRIAGLSFSVCLLLILLVLLPLGATSVMAEPAAATNQVSIPLYLAEGCTRPGFETWLCAQNLGEIHPYTLRVEYVTPAGALKAEDYEIPVNGRVTVYVNDVIGPGQDVSFAMTATVNSNMSRDSFARLIMVERPMYFKYQGAWDGGHVNTASVAPLPMKQYFAEGTTRPGFDEYICVLNPNPQAANLDFNYMIEGEGLKQVKRSIPARTRATFFVPDHIGRGKDVSLELVSDVRVVAERPMYFSYRNILNGKTALGGHVITGARGATGETRTFAFAPLDFVPGMGWGNTWVCLQNPNSEPAKVQITVSAAPNLVATLHTLPPQQRTTLFYPDIIPDGYTSKDPGAFSVRATDPGLPIIVERPIYLNLAFDGISGGSVTSGDSAMTWPDSSNKYAEGHTGDGFVTWMALTNLQNGYANDRYHVDCYFPGGVPYQSIAYDYSAEGKEPWECSLWRVNDLFPHTDIAFKTKQVYGERIMAFTYRQGWKGIHTSQGCPRPLAGI